MPRSRLLITLAGVAGLVLAACGGGGDDDAAVTTVATTGAPTSAGAGTTAPSDTTEPQPTPSLPVCPLDALDTADGKVEVVVWHSQVAKPLETIQALADEYNASQDAVTVRLESQGASYTELKRKFQAAVPTNDLPDLIVFDDTATQEMADSGVVLPGEACFAAAGEDLGTYSPMARSYYTVDGVLWPVTANLGGVLLYYNRDHFKKAGLDPADPPQTLAEVREAAEAIKAAGVADKPVVHALESWKTEFWLTGAGAPLVGNDNGRGPGTTDTAALADNPVALELFTWFADMTADGLLAPVPATDGQIDQYLALASQGSSMLVDTSVVAASIEAFLGGNLDLSELGASDAPSASGLDLWASGFPGLVPGNQTQMGGAAWYLLNTSPPEAQAAAWDFVAFLNQPEAQVELLTGGSYLPWRPDVLDQPAVTEYFATSLSGRWLEVAARQIDAIDPAFPGPLIGPYDPDVRDVIEDVQESMLLGGTSPQDALDEAQAEIDELLALYNESL